VSSGASGAAEFKIGAGNGCIVLAGAEAMLAGVEVILAGVEVMELRRAITMARFGRKELQVFNFCKIMLSPRLLSYSKFFLFSLATLAPKSLLPQPQGPREKGTEMEVKMDERNDMPLEETFEEVDSFSQFIGSAREVVAKYTHCALCGGNLHFTHITDFSKNLTQETARCPECGIRARRMLHRLQ
jgi:hypothetical protein